MLTKILSSAVVVLLSIVGMSVVSPSVTSNIPQAIGIVQSVHAAGETEPVTPALMGAIAVRRVMLLSANPATDRYPSNYMKLVEYAWQLGAEPEPADYASWSQELRTHYAVEIPYAMLEPGDILANGRGGDFGQAVVFARWENPYLWRNVVDPTDRQSVRDELKQGVGFVAYQVDRSVVPARVVEKHLTLQELQGAVTIADLDKQSAGPYYALRDRRIQGFVTLVDGVHALAVVKSGSLAYVQFSVINHGGSPVQVTDIGAVAYGPDAAFQGLASTQTNFQPVTQVFLQPGQVFKYSRLLKLERPGSYFALASFRVNGTMQVPLEPANFVVTAQ